MEIEAELIPRSLNEKADYLIKVVVYDDCSVKNCYFHAVTSYWGPCSVDCFAKSRCFGRGFPSLSLGKRILLASATCFVC